MSASQWAGFGTIDLGNGTDVLNVQVNGSMNISSGGVTNVSNVTTGNLIGTGGNDTVTLTGDQLDEIIIGSGTIDLGLGSDTINLTSTSDDLNDSGSDGQFDPGCRDDIRGHCRVRRHHHPRRPE